MDFSTNISFINIFVEKEKDSRGSLSFGTFDTKNLLYENIYAENIFLGGIYFSASENITLKSIIFETCTLSKNLSEKSLLYFGTTKNLTFQKFYVANLNNFSNSNS